MTACTGIFIASSWPTGRPVAIGDSRTSLERYFNRLWYERQQPGLGWRAASGLYRRFAAGHRPRHSSGPSHPIIVVGNITVGGGGKTPVVVAVARILLDAGHHPAIVSRGYRARSDGRPVRVGADNDPGSVGDEPVLLARRTGCPVWVSRQRVQAVERALAEGADVIVSDDGLQHRALPRSFEICVIDGRRGVGNGHLLPAGPLRQPASRLEQVDAVLIKGPIAAPGLTDLGAEVFELKAGELEKLGGSERRPLSDFSGREVDAVCGIANPESFFATLREHGVRARGHVFADHHDYRVTDLQKLHGPVVVTEKDAVKLERLKDLPDIWVLPVNARLPGQLVDSLLGHVREFRPA